MKSSRRQARGDALQILYQLDLNQEATVSHAMLHFESYYSQHGETDPFTQRLVMGIAEHLKEIDTVVEKYSEHWRVDRMAAVDRNILRLGTFELNFCDDIPATVTINEMIEVAKQFGSESSPAFINGVLDRMKSELNRPGKAP